MSLTPDTVAALATPAGTAALALIRVSGPAAAAVAREVLGRDPEPRRARHAPYRDRAGIEIDDVVATFFAGPKSYTGEDVWELTCHGNPYIAQRILEDLVARGCRLAEPGEFTRRAFLNGRMDLSQAEAVMEVIHARGERALAAARHHLQGGLGQRLGEIVDRVLGVLARLEAYIDFPEEDLPPEDRTLVARELEAIELMINRLASTSRYGELLREGVRTVLLGAPNAGKSSLLNRLLGEERALVSPEPGTTRDYLEERWIVGPHCLRLVDTAGLNLAPAPLERLGIAKTVERALGADLWILVLDATQSTAPELPAELQAKGRELPVIVVQNKVDLASAGTAPLPWPGASVVRTSALTGEGLEALRSEIIRRVDALGYDPGELVAVNARHAVALAEAATGVAAARAQWRDHGPVELVASEIRGILDACGRITGRIDHERMLDALFATFCIGK